MKNIEKSNTKISQQKLEAPVVLTPDQIAIIAAGASQAPVGRKIICGGMPAGPILGGKGPV